MSQNNQTVTSFPGTASLLGVLFIGLKLTGYISWPWLWVLSPFWIPLCIAILFFFMIGLIYIIHEVLSKIAK